MKRLLALLILSLTVGVPVLAQKIEVPPYHRYTLGNGLVVLIMEYHKLPLVEYRLAVRGGSSYDPEGKDGIASLTASLLRKGTTTRSAQQIAAAIDDIGGTLSASASRDFFFVTSEVLAKDRQTGLDLFSDIVLHPTFAPDELERARKQALAGLDDLKDNPSAVASLCFAKELYGRHPYGHQSDGTKASLAALTVDDVRAFYRKTFLPNASVLAIVGDFKETDMLALVKKAFDGWGEGTAEHLKAPALVQRKGLSVVLVDKPDLTQTQVRLGNIGVPRNTPDYFPIQVANSILGNGFTSRLVDEIRVKRSLTYGAGSRFSMGLLGGSYEISTFTKNATTREVIDVARNVVRDLRDKGPTQGEVVKAQNYVAGQFVRSLQSPEALASSIMDMELYQLPKNYLGTYVENLKAVNLTEVKRVLRKYFAVDDLLILVLAPRQSVEPTLTSLGPVRVVNFDAAVD